MSKEKIEEWHFDHTLPITLSIKVKGGYVMTIEKNEVYWLLKLPHFSLKLFVVSGYFTEKMWVVSDFRFRIFTKKKLPIRYYI